MDTGIGHTTYEEDKIAEIHRGVESICSVTVDNALESRWLIDNNELTAEQIAENEENTKKKLKYNAEYALGLLREIEESKLQFPEREEMIKILNDKVKFFQEYNDETKLKQLFYETKCEYTPDGKFDGIKRYKKRRSKGNFICPPGKVISNKAFATLIYFDSITFEEEAIEKNAKIRLPKNIKKLYILFGDVTRKVDMYKIGLSAELGRIRGKIYINGDRQFIIVCKPKKNTTGTNDTSNKMT